jgi:SAM-dependent methyltransferase
MFASKQFQELDYCMCCGGDNLKQYANLGLQPPPNRFLFRNSEEVLVRIPLIVNVCRECCHSQLKYAVNPNILFKDYPYRTGVSDTLVNHYQSLAIKSYMAWLLGFDDLLNSDKTLLKIMDIGCNDGTLLKCFENAIGGNVRLYGVDPCPVGEFCNSLGENIFTGYMGNSLFDEWAVNSSFDIITATNVLAHNIDPKGFLKACAKKIKPSGLICIEFPYCDALIKHCEFDTMYHEHYSYFLASSFEKLVEGTDLIIAGASIHDIHGGSLRIVLKMADSMVYTDHSDAFYELISNERNSIMNDIDIWNRFQSNIDNKCEELKDVVCEYANKGYSVKVFGASAKATVLLNYLSLPISNIYDETPSKIGKLMPGLGIEVKHPRDIDIYSDKQVYLIMAWNCYDECIRKLSHYLKGNSSSNSQRHVVAITHVPSVRTEDLV